MVSDSSPYSQDTPSFQQHSANLTIQQQQEVIDQLSTQVKELQALIKQLREERGNYNQRPAVLTEKQKKQRHLYKHGKYFWSHGGCRHTSKQCTKHLDIQAK